jgi:hypothetical protein
VSCLPTLKSASHQVGRSAQASCVHKTNNSEHHSYMLVVCLVCCSGINFVLSAELDHAHSNYKFGWGITVRPTYASVLWLGQPHNSRDRVAARTFC